MYPEVDISPTDLSHRDIIMYHCQWLELVLGFRLEFGFKLVISSVTANMR